MTDTIDTDLDFDPDTDEMLQKRRVIRDRLLQGLLLGTHSHKVITLEYDGYSDEGAAGYCDLKDPELSDFLWNLVCEHHDGFWNDTGGRGKVIWDLMKDEIRIEHGDVVEDTEDTVTVIDADGTHHIEEPSPKDTIKNAIAGCTPLRTFLELLCTTADDATVEQIRKVL